MKLSEDFYQRKNVVKIARELLGKVLYTRVNGVVTAGTIVETEAYSWKEKGCHAYNGRKTERNAIMFGKGGHTYVYLCYGIHYLFNVVTNVQDVADAVLIRAVEPYAGIDEMLLRRNKSKPDYHLTSGPGKLSVALGINKALHAKWLLEDEVWIEDLGIRVPSPKILTNPRIGIDYAGEDAKLLWRFSIQGNPWVSQ